MTSFWLVKEPAFPIRFGFAFGNFDKETRGKGFKLRKTRSTKNDNANGFRRAHELNLQINVSYTVRIQNHHKQQLGRASAARVSVHVT